VGQWGLGRIGGTDPADKINPVECIHLADDPDGSPVTADGQIVPGVWTLRVKLGAGGALPAQISQVSGPDEDANGNNRLDGGEDLDADSLLDKGGQVYAVVVAAPSWPQRTARNPTRFADYPASIARLDRFRYDCSDDAAVNIWDPDATSESLSLDVTIRVYSASGVLVDTETNLSFSESSHAFSSSPLAVRLGTGSPAAGIPGNGILEGDTGYVLEVTHSDPTPGSRTALGRAPMDCEPDLLGASSPTPGSATPPT